MTATTYPLTESLQGLIDARLDTLDRMLLGQVPRPERLAIVQDVETQIHQRLQERGGEELTREDVLAELAQLDPPEAYLGRSGDEAAAGPRVGRVLTVRAVPAAAPAPSRAARAGGILGLCALVLPLGFLLVWGLAIATQSEGLLYGGWALNTVWILATAIVGLVLSIIGRGRGAWPVIGLITSIVALVLLVMLGGGLGLLLLMH